jgi:hypothetical protein
MPQSILDRKFSIPTFCRTVGISHRTYRKLHDAGEGPHETRAGRRTVITAASALTWAHARRIQNARIWARRSTAIERS